MRLIWVGFAFAHHKGNHAGYDKIRNHIPYSHHVSGQLEAELAYAPGDNLFLKALRKVLRITFHTDFPLTALRVWFLSLSRDPKVFHFVYAENNADRLARLRSRGHRVICTFHQPADVLLGNPRYRRLMEESDKIILLSERDLATIANMYGHDKVHYVPHGVDTDFYTQNEGSSRKKHVLMVGNWLRDFAFAAKVFEKLKKVSPDCRISVVASPNNLLLLKKVEGLTLLFSISDEQLRDLYSEAACLFLPLSDFTANNAILEAAACGCPIILATPVPGDGYFDHKLVRTLPMDVSTVCDAVVDHLASETLWLSHQDDLRKFVREWYSWPAIADRTRSILEDR